MTTRKLPDGVRQAIADAIRAGGKRNQIAREHNVSPGTVSNIAAEYNIDQPFDRTATKQATTAAQVDHAAKLVELAGRAAAVAAAILDSYDAMDAAAWSGVSPHSRGIIAGIMLDKAAALAPQEDEGRAERRSALSELFELMRASSAGS